MLDIKLIQNDFENVAQSLRKKKVDESLLEELRALSLELKSARLVLEPLQAEQNAKSKLFGVYAKEGKDVAALKAELSLNKEKITEATEIVRALEEKLESLATIIPNMPSPLVPEGEDENDNVELKRVLEPKTFSFTPKEHWDIDIKQNWIDFERGVKLSKSRFSVLKNEAARLERALI
ncbi:MAG: serine--tRNA ligase, partial [Sulfurospirillum sp.]